MFETFQHLYQEYHVKSKTPQEEITQTALDTLEGYFRSHPLPSERIAQTQQVIAAENWPATPERDLQIACTFSGRNGPEHGYSTSVQTAADLARRSLKIKSNGKRLR